MMAVLAEYDDGLQGASSGSSSSSKPLHGPSYAYI